jgi:hypothetical protein
MMTCRDDRRADLWRIRRGDPAELLNLYRHIADLHAWRAIPPGQTFPTMIEAILDHEEAASKLANPPVSAST